jgi:hypothetical protein
LNDVSGRVNGVLEVYQESILVTRELHAGNKIPSKLRIIVNKNFTIFQIMLSLLYADDGNDLII